MAQALDLAQRAWDEGEVPVGAVVVSADNELLGSGYNQTIKCHDPSAHAEIIALRNAAVRIQNYRLNGTTLYVTLEPCCMCAGAMIHARVERLVCGTPDPKTGAAGSVFSLLKGAPLNHVVAVEMGCLQSRCSLMLRDFFKQRRSV